jgi:dynamin 1-like protein
MEIIIKCLSEERDKAREVVEAIIDSEQNYLFTNDLDYKENKTSIMTDTNNANSAQRALEAPGNQGPGGNQADQMQIQNAPGMKGSNVFVRDLRTRIDSYFHIVLRSVKDSIPKAIGYFLVRKSQEKLQFELYNQVNTNKSLTSSLGEPKNITERRKALQDILKTLKNSLKVLQRDPE